MKGGSGLPLGNFSIESQTFAHLHQVVVEGFSTGGCAGLFLASGPAHGGNGDGYRMDADLSATVTAPVFVVRPQVNGQGHSSGVGDTESELVLVFGFEDNSPGPIESNTGRPQMFRSSFANAGV